MTHLWLHPKTHVWYFKRTIPAPLRPHMGHGKAGKWDWLESLQTKDYEEAKRRAGPVRIKFDAAVGEARRVHREAQGKALQAPPTPSLVIDGGEWLKGFAAMMQAPDVPVPVYDEITLADAKVMAGAWVRDRLAGHEDRVAIHGVPVLPAPEYGPVPIPELKGLWIGGDVEAYRVSVGTRLNRPAEPPLSVGQQIRDVTRTGFHVEMAVWRVAAQFGLTLDPEGESWKRLRYAILLGEQTLLEQTERINRAETVLAVPAAVDALPVGILAAKPPEPEPESAPVPTGPTVRTAWDSYLAREKPSTGTADEFRRGWEIFFEAFPDFIWDSPLSSIERGHVRAFRDTLLKLPARFSLKREYQGKAVPEILQMVGDKPDVERLKSATVNKYLSGLRVTFNHGIEEFDLTQNPVALLSVNVDDSDDGVPLTTEELVRLFGNERFTRGTWNAEYWIPALCLYTGARLNEMGQLYMDDIRQERGIDYLDLNDNRPDKSLKNGESARRVPIHPELVRLGFLEFVQRQRAAGHDRLFPELKYDEKQGYTRDFSREFSRFKKKIGITGAGKKLHSLRHNWKDAAREADIRQEIYDTIQGHSGSKNVGSSYGKGFSLTVLSEAMSRIEFPGVVIPRVGPRKS